MTFKEVYRQRFLHDLGFDFRQRSGIESHFRIIAKSHGIICGLIFVPTLLKIMEDEFFLEPLPDGEGRINKVHTITAFLKRDGEEVKSGDIIAKVAGDSEILLKTERHICDILSRLSGIATRTSKKVSEMNSESVFLLDTRKDDPLRRPEDKYAVKIGGARNHRGGFYDGTLIKDNDIKVYGGIKSAIDAGIKETKFLTMVEIEVGNMVELEEVLSDGRVHAILLDNMHPGLLIEAVRRIKASGKPYLIEASGIGSNSIQEVASTGVTCISLSSLTEGAERLDISMKAVSEM